jgi:hypothetical protein
VWCSEKSDLQIGVDLDGAPAHGFEGDDVDDSMLAQRSKAGGRAGASARAAARAAV